MQRYLIIHLNVLIYELLLMNEHHIDIDNLELIISKDFQLMHEENIKLKILMILMLMFELILIVNVHFVVQQFVLEYEELLILL
jgi:hypothetical protein